MGARTRRSRPCSPRRSGCAERVRVVAGHGSAKRVEIDGIGGPSSAASRRGRGLLWCPAKRLPNSPGPSTRHANEVEPERESEHLDADSARRGALLGACGGPKPGRPAWPSSASSSIVIASVATVPKITPAASRSSARFSSTSRATSDVGAGDSRAARRLMPPPASHGPTIEAEHALRTSLENAIDSNVERVPGPDSPQRAVARRVRASRARPARSRHRR